MRVFCQEKQKTKKKDKLFLLNVRFCLFLLIGLRVGDVVPPGANSKCMCALRFVGM